MFHETCDIFVTDSVCRPVLILGPLSECVAEKMSIDFPQLFQRCMMTPMNCTSAAMEKGLENNIFIDYRKRGSIFECTTVQAIRDICDKVMKSPYSLASFLGITIFLTSRIATAS